MRLNEKAKSMTEPEIRQWFAAQIAADSENQWLVHEYEAFDNAVKLGGNANELFCDLIRRICQEIEKREGGGQITLDELFWRPKDRK